MTSPSRPAVIYVAGEPVYLEQRCVPCRTTGMIPDAMWVAVADAFERQHGHRSVIAAMDGVYGADQRASARGLWMQAGADPDATPEQAHTCTRCGGDGYARTPTGVSLAEFILRVTGEIR